MRCIKCKCTRHQGFCLHRWKAVAAFPTRPPFQKLGNSFFFFFGPVVLELTTPFFSIIFLSFFFFFSRLVEGFFFLLFSSPFCKAAKALL